MNLTSFYFLCAFALILLIYYIVPKRMQWLVLLLSSIAYYCLAGNPVLIAYPVISILVCYAITCMFSRFERIKSVILGIGVCSLLAVLLLLKYLRFSSAADLLIPLGLSYYTFTLIGYIVDVYYGISPVQRNPFKLLAFGMYFPTLVSGPIMQYREVQESFFASHSFDYHEFTYGLQRILWGFFKKLVIAERLGILVATVYSSPADYGGRYVWLAILAFTFQLYTDFSGLMDIVIGISQCFGITIPENFKNPFFSKTISEYWRRWHITLGIWFKEYVFYRILRTHLYSKLQQTLRSRFGKKRGKQLATFAAMFVLWLTVGLWHGGNMTFVIGSGLLHWFYIVMEELLEAPMSGLLSKAGIKKDAGWLEVVRIIRTFILVNIGNAFFRSASVADAMLLFKAGLQGKSASFTGNVFDLGLDWIEMGVVLVSLIILLVVSLIQAGVIHTGYESVRDLISSKPVILRYICWLALLFYCILLAQYGPGFSAAEFIYQGF